MIILRIVLTPLIGAITGILVEAMVGLLLRIFHVPPIPPNMVGCIAFLTALYVIFVLSLAWVSE